MILKIKDFYFAALIGISKLGAFWKESSSKGSHNGRHSHKTKDDQIFVKGKKCQLKDSLVERRNITKFLKSWAVTTHENFWTEGKISREIRQKLYYFDYCPFPADK